jgi:hypothetical protein
LIFIIYKIIVRFNLGECVYRYVGIHRGIHNVAVVRFFPFLNASSMRMEEN